MTLEAWGSATAIVAGSLLLCHALNLLGLPCRAAAPAVGLSLLLLIASVAIKLPGSATTAVVVLVAMLLAAAGLVIVRRGPLHFPGVTLAVGAVAGFGAAIPFIANGRVGLPGTSLDDDTASHLLFAESLRSAATRTIYGSPTGYPLGPHSVADAISSGLGVRLDLAFTGLLIATVITTALVAAAALRGESAWKRLVAGGLGALPYLVAAYYGEGAFKEPLLGLLLLATVLHLEGVCREWVPGAKGRWRSLLPVSLLVAAGFYVFSYPALAWFGLTLVIWLASEAIARPRRSRRLRAHAVDLAGPVAGATALLVLLLAPIAGQIFSFAGTIGVSPASTGAISTSNLGNLAHPLSPYEALGVWNSADFRFLPANVFHAGELSGLALGVLLFGLVWAIARRELLLPAAVAACAIVYWRLSHTQSPYVSAKALVIAGPVVAVTGLRGLLCSPAKPIMWSARVSRMAAAGGFILLAAHSSYDALRNEPVWPAASTQELLSLDRLTRGQSVLFLGNTDYAEWLFHDSKMTAMAADNVNVRYRRPTKPFVYGTSLDFDSVDTWVFSHFRWMITTNTPYASQAPAGVRLVHQLPMYDLWERVGTVVPRQTLEAPGTPGFILDCHSRVGRQLSRQRGVAAVMTPPVIQTMAPIPPGGVERVTMLLPAGRWELSLQYTSAMDLTFLASEQRWRMPAYLDRPGPWFAIGAVTSAGTSVVVTVRADRPSSLTGANLSALTTALVATRIPDIRSLMPLRRSCGRYIDWYRT